MGNLRLVCSNCDSTTFNIQKSAQYATADYECICAECGKLIATIGNYNINWVTKEEDTNDSNPTA
mgnify:FL=1